MAVCIKSARPVLKTKTKTGEVKDLRKRLLGLIWQIIGRLTTDIYC